VKENGAPVGEVQRLCGDGGTGRVKGKAVVQ